MHETDKLDEITEAYLNQRIYAPHLEISPYLIAALEKEFERHIKDGANPNRILKAIEFVAAKVKQNVKNLVDLQKPIEKTPEKLAPTGEQRLRDSGILHVADKSSEIQHAPRFRF